MKKSVCKRNKEWAQSEDNSTNMSLGPLLLLSPAFAGL